jgi:hypothetical protein
MIRLGYGAIHLESLRPHGDFSLFALPASLDHNITRDAVANLHLNSATIVSMVGVCPS